MTTGYLLDTNVVSEPRKQRPNPGVVGWFEDHARDDFYLSALVIGEVRQGIELLRPRDESRALVIEQWLENLVSEYDDRILPVTVAVAEEWGRINASAQRPPASDALIAATAKVHGLVLVTRNVVDIERTGVTWENPFA